MTSIKGKYVLRKFSGKGGWTYAEIPEIRQDKQNPFGWVVVNGSIDDHELQHFKLMPMGDGKLFLTVNAALRKKLNKKAGDEVYITIEVAERHTYQVPEAIQACLELEDPKITEQFESFTDSEKKAYVDWVKQAKSDNTRIERLVRMMKNIEKGKKWHEMDI